jgi:hypothetical protein
MKFTTTIALALAGFSSLIAAAPAGNYAIPNGGVTLPAPAVRPDNVDPNTVYYPPPPPPAGEPAKTLPPPLTRPAGVDPDTTYTPPPPPADYGKYPGAGENLPSYPNYGTY